MVFAKRLFRDKRFRHGGAALLLTVLFAAALVATFCFKVGPIALLAAAGVIGLIIY